MMSLTRPETQALGSIADGLAGADPRLASMLTIFSRLAAGEEMPARQADAGGRHFRRADPHRQQPHDLRPVDGNGVPRAVHRTAGRRGRTLMRGARK